MTHKHTPLRFVRGQFMAWIKNTNRGEIMLNGDKHNLVKPGEFYLAVPYQGDIVLHELWGKPHTTHMTPPFSVVVL